MFAKRSLSASVTSLVSLVAALALLMGPAPQTARAQDLISCDTVRTLGNGWRVVQTARNVNIVACYQVDGTLVQTQGNALFAELRVTSGNFDVYVLSGAASTGNTFAAQQVNTAPVRAGTGWVPFIVTPINNGIYTLAIAPSVDGARGSFQLRLSGVNTGVPPVPPGPPTQPTAIPLPPLPNTQVCSNSWGTLSNFCVQPSPVAVGGTTYAVWRIGNFRNGEFDRGDGQGFRGPIAAEMRVDVPNVNGPRTVRLHWFDLSDREYYDNITIQVANVPPPPSTIDAFPCSRAGIGISNLCIQQPYPVPVGSTAYAVWRIQNFVSGQFDRGDGAGYQGSISAEQRIDIPNITSNRTVRLRWIDSGGVTHEDSFTIQVY